MTYGFETYRADTTVNQDGSNPAGVYIETLSMGATSGSKSYSMIPAGGLVYYDASTFTSHTISVDSDGSGFARLNWTWGGNVALQSTTLIVFAKKLNPADSYGISLTNANGDILADYNYPVPQYKGKINPVAAATSSAYAPGGYTVHYHTLPYSIPNVNFMYMYLPDNTSDIWYNWSYSADGSGNGAVSLEVYAPSGASYQVPSFHAFSFSNIQSSGSTYAIQLRKADTTLTYDSAAENLTINEILTTDYATNPTANYYSSGAMPTYVGVHIRPYLKIDYLTTSGGWTRNRYFGSVRRQGGGVYTKLSWKDSAFTSVALANYSYRSQNNYFPLVNLTYLSPSTVTGIPGSLIATYPTHINPGYLNVYEEDTTPVYSIGPTGTTAGNWFSGSGDSNLYEVKVTHTSGSGTIQSGFNNYTTWYSLHAWQHWGITEPNQEWGTRSGEFSYQIRIKATLEVVVNSSFGLTYYRTGEGVPP